MGYVRPRKTYRLVFTDDDVAGLEVVARSASVADYRRIADLATRQFSSPPTPEDLTEIDHLFGAFAQVLESWNLEEPEGVPVPATLDGLKSQELPFVTQIILAWMETVAGVAPPLVQPSDGGGLSLEESLPMEVLSPSL
jgi:hypothetical protein